MFLIHEGLSHHQSFGKESIIPPTDAEEPPPDHQRDPEPTQWGTMKLEGSHTVLARPLVFRGPSGVDG